MIEACRASQRRCRGGAHEDRRAYCRASSVHDFLRDWRGMTFCVPLSLFAMRALRPTYCLLSPNS
jgi:hypothetical protein